MVLLPIQHCYEIALYFCLQYLLSGTEGQAFRDIMKSHILTLVTMATQQGQVGDRKVY